MPDIILTGLNHKTTPVEIREKLAFDDDGCRRLLSQLHNNEGIHEAAVLSTCNRTELYVVCERSKPWRNGGLAGVLTDFAACPYEQFDHFFYKAQNEEAVEHLCRVAAGIDSLVIGEDQILGQVRHAYTIAVSEKRAGTLLHRIFHQAFRVGKRSRSETKIGSGTASIGSVAVDLAGKIFSNLSDKNVLLIGAGEIAQVTLMNLKSGGIRHLYITNRTYSKAAELAREFGGLAVPFDRLEEALGKADVVIGSTASKNAIISSNTIKNAMLKRRNRPLFLIDIAVPGDIDRSAKDLYNVFLYDIDDLKQIVDHNLKLREREIPLVEKIIAEELDNFRTWQKSNAVLPTIKELQVHIENIRKREVERNQKFFLQEDWEQIDKFSKSLLQKILHSPMVRLHACRDTQEICGRCTIREVFGLDEDE